MIRINLLPREIYIEEAKRQIKAVVVSAVLVLLAGLLLIYGWEFNAKHREETKNVELNMELRKYQAIVDQVNELQQTRDLLKARRDVIQRLLVGRLVYPKFFDDFTAILPSEIWVTSIGTTLEGDGVMNVTISAQSLSSFAIADWLTNLQSSPLCSEVKLGTITTQEQGEGKAPLLAFSLTFRYLRRGT
jgi:Tfp pilus assembly protein PilN